MVIDVKKEREARGLTQKALAVLVKVHIRTVQKWEDENIRDMKLSTYTRLKAVFMMSDLCEASDE
jgi:DNA-binding transcriptional regulator YiaG